MPQDKNHPSTLQVALLAGVLVVSAAFETMLANAFAMPGGIPEHFSSISYFNTYQGRNLGVSLSNIPALLSKKDRELYRNIFAAQKSGDWHAADDLIRQLSNMQLMGHVLATRYLHPDYKSSAVELAEWLDAYKDLPQAYEISSLAHNKPAKSSLPVIRKRSILQGYGDDNGLAAWSASGNNLLAWHQAMDAWRKNDKAKAAALFSSLANNQKVHAWKHAGAAFWAWRSYKAIGDNKQAYHYLKLAASNQRSFYGIMARRELGQSLELDKNPITLSDSDVLEIIGEPAIRRVIALSESGIYDLAEKELRFLFPQVDKKEKLRLLALAHKLNLASVQIAMSQHLKSDGRALDFARYPIPNWKPYEGFKVDPALIYALARQESGFHASAKSNAGASGIMQLMPQTAVLMKKRFQKNAVDISLLSASHNEPVMNLTLGQNYVEHLLENALVDNNLLYMLIAYNAGPGRLMEWKKTIDFGNDPLLFLESIPFGETRNYVMQVMTNYWIYSELAGTPSASLYVLLQGKWPTYHPTPFAASAALTRQAS